MGRRINTSFWIVVAFGEKGERGYTNTCGRFLTAATFSFLQRQNLTKYGKIFKHVKSGWWGTWVPLHYYLHPSPGLKYFTVKSDRVWGS